MLQMVLRKKYKGNTLPDVLIALSITAFCTTLAVMIYLNIQKSTMPFIRIKSNDIANKYLTEATTKKDYFDNVYTKEEYSIKKSIKRSDKYPDCMIIKIEVYDVFRKKLNEVQSIKYAE
jgi:hypothetical protein